MFGFFILSISLFLSLLYKLLDTYYSLREPKDHLDETNSKGHAKQQQEEEQVDINNLWSELDPNLLGEILGRLCCGFRFRVVCKNWMHAHSITPVRKPLLWYLSFDRSLFELQLHDPSSPDPASVENISLPNLGIPAPSSYKHVSSSLLKHNWLVIILVKRRRLWFWKRIKYILLVSPFTKKVVILPKFDYPCPFKKFTFMYSTQPDSPDCVFFLVDTCNADDKVRILTHRNGDKEWIAKEFDAVSNFVQYCCKLIYLGGILYIVSPYGQLASYNIVDGKFKFECPFVDELFRLNISTLYSCRGFELNGELMMIHFVPYEEMINVELPSKPYIKRYNWSRKDWIPVSTLGDKSVFFSDENSQVTIINKDDVRNSGVLSNKIYQFFDDGCLIYSMEDDGELVVFKSINYSKLMEEAGGSDLPGYKYKGASHFLDTTKATYWLEPPRGSS